MRGVKLDWRFEAHRRFSEFQLQGLQEFHAHLKENSTRAMVAWGRACEGLTDKNSPAADELAEERDRIESVLDIGQTLSILGLYAFLENYMDLVIEYLRAGGAKFSSPGKRKGESKLEKLRKKFFQVGVDLKKPPFSWESLDQMREIRNCIAHDDGWVSEAVAERLQKLGLSVRKETQLRPPATDFERWYGLVDETCRGIHAECSSRYLDQGLP